MIIIPISLIKYIMIILGSIGSIALSGVLISDPLVLKSGIEGHAYGMLLMIGLIAGGILLMHREGFQLKFVKYISFLITACLIGVVANGWGQAGAANRVVCVLHALVFLAAGIYFTLRDRRAQDGPRSGNAHFAPDRAGRTTRLLRWHSVMRVALIAMIGVTLVFTALSAMHKDVETIEAVTVAALEPYTASMGAGTYVTGRAWALMGSFDITTRTVTSDRSQRTSARSSDNPTSVETYYIIMNEDGEEGYIHGDNQEFAAFRDAFSALTEDFSKPWPEAFEYRGKTCSFPTARLTPSFGDAPAFSLVDGLAGRNTAEGLAEYQKNNDLLQSIVGKTYVELDDITIYQSEIIPGEPVYLILCTICWGLLIICACAYLALRHGLVEETRQMYGFSDVSGA